MQMSMYECLCLATVSEVPEFQQSGRKCQQIHQHAEVAFNFRGREVVLSLLLSQFCLIYRKLLSGCSFNEGMVGQFCNYWHKESFRNLFLNVFIDCSVLHTKRLFVKFYIYVRICWLCWQNGVYLKLISVCTVGFGHIFKWVFFFFK